ncbi:MAG: ATP-binding protein [Planctomycetota bacterium]
MTPLSLKWRVSLLVSIVLVAIIATISIVAYVEFEESHLRQTDRTLLAMANGILANFNDHEDKETLMEEIRAVTGRSGRDPSTLYRIWMDGSSADLYVSDAPDSEYGRWLRELPELRGTTEENYVFVNIGRRGNEYRAVWMRHEIDDGIVNIVVAGASHFTFHELYEFLRLLLILGGSLILGSVAAIMWTVRCGLRPIDTTAERLRRISGPDAGKALFDDLKVPKELNPFVGALRDMLGRLDRVLRQQRQFSSDAAHELRTPLAGVKSTLQAAQMRPRQADEYKRAIDDALKDVARMELLMEQLLILARLDEVNGPLHAGVVEVRLDELLGELAQTYDEKARLTGGKVVLEESSTTPVRGSLDDLARLFGNVIDNAAKYGPPDGTISITLKSEPDNCITVCVHDEGGNIPPEALSRLCDRFYRVDESRSSSTGGAGLGLAIARETVYRHGGKMSITSDINSGTLVCVRLPRA